MSRRREILSIVRRCLFGLAALLMSGCGGGQERFTPDTTDARTALETALAAWRDGAPYETIKSSTVPINVFDARWQAGQKLERFEIIEELPADPHPAFRVTLRLAGNPADEQSTYVVMGIDPLLVWRSEDLERATGM